MVGDHTGILGVVFFHFFYKSGGCFLSMGVGVGTRWALFLLFGAPLCPSFLFAQGSSDDHFSRRVVEVEFKVLSLVCFERERETKLSLFDFL